MVRLKMMGGVLGVFFFFFLWPLMDRVFFREEVGGRLFLWLGFFVEKKDMEEVFRFFGGPLLGFLKRVFIGGH